MKKLKVTRNDLKYDKCICVGYCNMSALLRFESPIGYNAGIYGWNYDAYRFNKITITTGYRNMVGVSVDYSIIKPYEKKARLISRDYSLKMDVARAKTESLLYQCLDEIYKRYFEEV